LGGGATEGGTDAALREDYEAHLKESKAIIDDLRSVKQKHVQLTTPIHLI
jgi:hypothetical protein